SFFFSSRRRHTRSKRDWSSDVCSSDLGSLTLSMLVLPTVILTAREALRSVPSSIRQASMGLGATKWRTIWHQVLPPAVPGIVTRSEERRVGKEWRSRGGAEECENRGAG